MPLPPIKMTSFTNDNRNQFQQLKIYQNKSKSLTNSRASPCVESSPHIKLNRFQIGSNNIKNQAVISRQNLQAYDVMKASLKNIRAEIACNMTAMHKNKNKSHSSQRSACSNIKNKTTNQQSNQKDNEVNGSSIKLRIRTELQKQTDNKLDHSEVNNTDPCFRISNKRYAQLSLRQIVEKDTNLYLWNKKTIILQNTTEQQPQKKKSEPFEGW